MFKENNIFMFVTIIIHYGLKHVIIRFLSRAQIPTRMVKAPNSELTNNKSESGLRVWAVGWSLAGLKKEPHSQQQVTGAPQPPGIPMYTEHTS